MCLLNLKFMTYLLESQGSDLFRPFTVKIPGTVNLDLSNTGGEFGSDQFKNVKN